MKALRILQIVPTLGIGGAETLAAQLARALKRRGHDAGVASMFPPETSALDELLAKEGVRVWYLNKRPGCDLRIWPRLARVLAEFRPDVLHTHLSILQYVLPPLLRHRPRLMVHTIHSLADKETSSLMRFTHRVAFRAGAIPVAVSAAVAASLDDVYGVRQCRHIANGIQVASYGNAAVARAEWRARLGFGADDVLFVCVARLKAVKNHRMLLDAFARMPAQNKRTRLLLLGEGPLQASLESYAQSAGIADRAHFLGLRDDVPDALAAADVFVLSSKWEGNPLSVMEAMAAGLPVVATRVGGIPELVEHGVHGMLVPAGDAGAMSHALALLADSPDLRQAWSAAARRRAVESFDIERMVDNYESLYLESLELFGSPGMKTAISASGELVN